MNNEGRALTAKKACIRCSKSKKRCDRAIPCCGLCARLGQRCEYDTFKTSYFGPVSIASKTSLGSEAAAIKCLKDAVIRELDPLTPESTLLVYRGSIEPWFPIAYNLKDRLRPVWEEVTLDVALLCLSICLVTTNPSSILRSDGPQFTNTYLQTKSTLALAEALGMNSPPIVQSRILLTLFEVSHGFYPAAYISIATTLRAADALEIHPMDEALQRQCISRAVSQEEACSIWGGILVLDRYIAIESGSQASLTRPRVEWLNNLFRPVFCPTHMQDQDKNSPLVRFSRMVEASAVLDKIHSAIHDPTSEHEFNKQEIILGVETSITFRGLLAEEIPPQDHIYSSGIALCHIALLLVFENSTRVASSMIATNYENLFDTTMLKHILPTVASTVEPFTTGTWSMDLNYFPPLVTFLVYKAAMLTTQRLSLEIDDNEGLARLKALRKFLSIVSERWLSCKRYLEILDENTTPRMLKAL
ncbi:hypothetical protein DM02DRAFT_566804, partial [Periconia macrospinosa]